MAAETRSVGPYELGDLLGTGGMGSVYRAFDRRLDRPVALKRIHKSANDIDRARERFRREAKAIAQLNHPAIVQVYDLVQEDGEDWLVMELVEGSSLASLLRQGKVDLHQMVLVAREVLSGLGAAHERGIVHRDLKAENVLITPAGHAKILDFGLAKRLDHDSAFTADGTAVGTIRAMAPEQVHGRDVDPRTDLYALGVLLYESLSGGNPFLGDSHAATLQRVLVAQPEALAKLRADIPPALSDLVDRLLAKEPDDRPGSAAEVDAELADLAGSLPGSLPVSPLLRLSGSQARAILPPTQAMPRAQARQVAPPSGSHRWRWVAAVGGATVLAVTAAALWLREGEPPPRLQVAVLRAEVSGPEEGPAALLASAIREALVADLATRPGLRVTAPEVVDTVVGTPSEVAKAIAAGALLSSSAECSRALCQVALRRLDADGSIAWSDSFAVPLDDLGAAASAVTAHGNLAFPAHPRDRDRTSGAEVSGAVFQRFVELGLAGVQRDGTSRQDLIERLAPLLKEAPDFLEATLLASWVHRLEFVERGEPGDAQQAVAHARHAHALAPRDPRAARALFDALLVTNDLLGATAALDALAALDPGDPRVLVSRALLLERQGSSQEALGLVAQAAEMLPAWDVLYNAATLEYRLGQSEAARAHLEAVLARLPSHFDALSLLGQIELSSGDLGRAVSIYEGLVERSPGLAEVSNLGVAHLLAGKWSEACRRFDEAVAMAPDNPAVLLNSADCRLAAGDPQARSLYQKALRLLGDPTTDDYVTAMVRAQAAAQIGQADDAIGAINEALRLAPNNPEVSYAAAAVYAVLGERQSAIRYARLSLQRGFEPRWFSLPWFAELRQEPVLAPLLSPSAAGSPSA